MKVTGAQRGPLCGPNISVIERQFDSVHKADGGLPPRCLVNTDVKVDGVLGFLTKMNKEFEYTSNSRLNKGRG